MKSSITKIALAVGLLALGAVQAFAVSVPTLTRCVGQTHSTGIGGGVNASVTITNPAVGSVLIITGGQFDSGALSTVVNGAGDNQGGNTYTVDVTKYVTAGMYANQFSLFIASTKVAVSSGTFTVSVSVNNAFSTSVVEWNVCEWAWPDPSVFAANRTGTAQGASNPITVTASAANTYSDSFVVAICWGAQGVTGSSGYTQMWADSTVLGLEIDSKNVSAGETSSASWAFAPSATLPAVLATYRSTPAAGGTTKGMLTLGVGD